MPQRPNATIETTNLPKSEPKSGEPKSGTRLCKMVEPQNIQHGMSNHQGEGASGADTGCPAAEGSLRRIVALPHHFSAACRSAQRRIASPVPAGSIRRADGRSCCRGELNVPMKRGWGVKCRFIHGLIPKKGGGVLLL